MAKKTPPKKDTRSVGQRFWRSVKRVFLFLFVAQLVYIIVLKWIDPPNTLTQMVSLIGGDGLKLDYVSRDEI